MTAAARNLMTDLETKGQSFAPEEFVEMMRNVYPQFNETDK